MSNEMMTDARALADSLDQIQAASYGGYERAALPHDVRDVLTRAAARLRGEAAQGEQQAVAWQPIATVPRDGTSVVVALKDGGISSARYNQYSEPQATHWVVLERPGADRPQPVAVAGDAVRALRELRDEALRGSFADTLSGDHDAVKRMLRRIADQCDAALSAAPAAPAPVAGDAVAKLAAEWRERWDAAESDHKPALNFWMAAGELEAALAQDRASQESEQSIKADAYDMIAEAVEKSGARVTSIVDHVTGLIASQGAAAGVPEQGWQYDWAKNACYRAESLASKLAGTKGSALFVAHAEGIADLIRKNAWVDGRPHAAPTQGAEREVSNG